MVRYWLTVDCKKLFSNIRASTLYIWSIIEKRLLHEIVIPTFEDQIISQISFLGNTRVFLNDLTL
jgi:hypothetical protein